MTQRDLPFLSALSARHGFRASGAPPWTLRAVVLRHEWETRGSAVHWDLLLDDADLCTTWWCRTDPTNAGRGTFDLNPQLDHRRLYLTAEGPVSGGRGTIARAAAGTVEIREESGAMVWRIAFARADGVSTVAEWRFAYAGGDHPHAWRVTVESA